MKKYQAILIDDEPTARDILERHLDKMDRIDLVASCKNAVEGFSALSSHHVDLIFLDINMPEVTGLMFANAVKGNTEVIFTTAYREYAVEGFELDALDYLMKPISLERLMKAVNKFLSVKEEEVVSMVEEDFTFFRSERKMVKVSFEDLFYVESCGDYIKLQTTKGMITTRETMQNVISKLPERQFLRTHRSFIVSLSKIDSFTNEHVTIERTAIPLSRSYKDAVLERLNKL
ncbi:MAG: response regulator transcription factor [Bacteroidota bacterium]